MKLVYFQGKRNPDDKGLMFVADDVTNEQAEAHAEDYISNPVAVEVIPFKETPAIKALKYKFFTYTEEL